MPLPDARQHTTCAIAPTTPSAPLGSVMEYLEADHRRLDAILSRTQGRVAAGDMSGAAREFAPFHDGLLRHIRIEEDLVFPDFEEATGMAGGRGPTAVMRLEHAEIQRLLALMKTHLESPASTSTDFESLRTALVGVLSAHNMKEEQILYPMTDREVPPARLQELMRKIRDTP